MDASTLRSLEQVLRYIAQRSPSSAKPWLVQSFIKPTSSAIFPTSESQHRTANANS